VLLKGGQELTVIKIEKNKELALDPIRHLVELKKRLRRKKVEIEGMKSTRFWIREDGSEMSYDMIRRAAVSTMVQAGITDGRSYHLKHAAVSELERLQVRPESIAAFARHKQGSVVWASNYWDSRNSVDNVKKLAEIK
jgi:hypothetical protein